MTPARPSSPPISKPALDLARRAAGPDARLTEVAGDASSRRFYRLSGGAGSMILMEHPGPLDDASSFYSNLRIMNAIGAPVPRLFDRDDAAGLVLVEDLGEVTLQRQLRENPDPVATRALYRQACDLIVLFHRSGMKAAGEGEFARNNALDRERFLAELSHFHRHFVGGLGAERPKTAEEAVLTSFYDDLASACDRLPRVYCHRDFQSRNLMVRDGRLALIDFQDARQGPYTYDAASLLRDSSLDLDERLVDEMLDHLSAELSLPGEELRRDFDLMALQRNIKDLGTFAYQVTERGRREYLDYVPRTIRFVRNALLNNRRYDTPYAVLERFILRYRA